MSDIVLENGLPPEDGPSPEAAPEAAVEAPVEQWAPSRQDWEALTGRLESLSSQFAPPVEEPQQADLSGYADPNSGELTLEGIERYVNDRIDHGVNSRLSQVEPVL